MVEPFGHLLVPVDFSEHSLNALRVADGLARETGARMHLVHVLERWPYEFYGAEGMVLDAPSYPVINGQVYDMEAIQRDVTKQLAKLAAENRGGPCTSNVRIGHPVEGILAEAKEKGCTAIVICTHGRTGLYHLVMGSVAEKIVRLSPVPVLSIRATGIGD
jgi:nucleotide-binding universal stress UspA family protein